MSETDTDLRKQIDKILEMDVVYLPDIFTGEPGKPVLKPVEDAFISLIHTRDHALLARIRAELPPPQPINTDNKRFMEGVQAGVDYCYLYIDAILTKMEEEIK